MNCRRCGSPNVTVSVVNDMQLKDRHKGCLWWVLIGWWWLPLKWLVFTLPALIIAIFKPKKQRIVNKHRTVCTCQQCGYSWQQ